MPKTIPDIVGEAQDMAQVTIGTQQVVAELNHIQKLMSMELRSLKEDFFKNSEDFSLSGLTSRNLPGNYVKTKRARITYDTNPDADNVTWHPMVARDTNEDEWASQEGRISDGGRSILFDISFVSGAVHQMEFAPKVRSTVLTTVRHEYIYHVADVSWTSGVYSTTVFEIPDDFIYFLKDKLIERIKGLVNDVDLAYWATEVIRNTTLGKMLHAQKAASYLPAMRPFRRRRAYI